MKKEHMKNLSTLVILSGLVAGWWMINEDFQVGASYLILLTFGFVVIIARAKY